MAATGETTAVTLRNMPMIPPIAVAVPSNPIQRGAAFERSSTQLGRRVQLRQVPMNAGPAHEPKHHADC